MLSNAHNYASADCVPDEMFIICVEGVALRFRERIFLPVICLSGSGGTEMDVNFSTKRSCNQSKCL